MRFITAFALIALVAVSQCALPPKKAAPKKAKVTVKKVPKVSHKNEEKLDKQNVADKSILFSNL